MNFFAVLHPNRLVGNLLLARGVGVRVQADWVLLLSSCCMQVLLAHEHLLTSNLLLLLSIRNVSRGVGSGDHLDRHFLSLLHVHIHLLRLGSLQLLVLVWSCVWSVPSVLVGGLTSVLGILPLLVIAGLVLVMMRSLVHWGGRHLIVVSRLVVMHQVILLRLV